ncbi:uncharacterized protein METZ01_LOCUS157407 [marine metagenome]|uniref:Uncharacterized protein n=1 Tax=marine metagenome TaxID=408172 RepID=A0A382AU55_9ZZZZ
MMVYFLCRKGLGHPLEYAFRQSTVLVPMP